MEINLRDCKYWYNKEDDTKTLSAIRNKLDFIEMLGGLKGNNNYIKKEFKIIDDLVEMIPIKDTRKIYEEIVSGHRN